MDINFLNQKNTQNKGKKKDKQGKWGGSIAGAIIFFFLVTGLYILVSQDAKEIPEIAISDLAKNVSQGEVKSILVEGDKLTITFKNDEIKASA